MHLFAVDGLPEIAAGDDLAALIDARVEFEDGDVLCVASTVVSKAEGRSYDYEDFEAGEWSRDIAARLESITGDEKDPRFAQAVIEESEELIVEAPFILAVTKFGHITVNAGIDRSNVPDGDLLLLPEDPSASAQRLSDALGVAGLAGLAGRTRSRRPGTRRHGPVGRGRTRRRGESRRRGGRRWDPRRGRARLGVR